MPYIKDENNKRHDIYVGNTLPSCAGELNFLITKIIIDYIDTKGLSYQSINDIMGALEGSKMEFYRRIVGNYEDIKIRENKDVYFK